MKTRYGLISILGIVAIIILITTWSSCRCRKKGCPKYHKEGLENAEDPNKVDEEEEEPEKTETKPPKVAEGMKYKRQKESFENFYNNKPQLCNNCRSIPYNPTTKINSHWTCSNCKGTKESFDNMSNFNNIQFSNPTSPDSILNFFKDIMFSADCCPSSFSTDKGCACISPSQYSLLKHRFGNNVPYSEF